MVTVLESVDALLDDTPLDLMGQAQAAVARVLAAKLDDARSSTSGAVAVAVPGVARELLSILTELTADTGEVVNFVDGLFGRSAS
jgi:hypothetical protein